VSFNSQNSVSRKVRLTLNLIMFFNTYMDKKFLFISGNDLDNTKKIKKHLKRKNLIKHFCIAKDSFVESLKSFLVENLKRENDFVYVLTDSNRIVVRDFMNLPSVPNGEWDILYLECDVQSYDYKQSSTFWCKTTAFDSGHFVINTKSIRNILSILKESKTRNDFFKLVNHKMLNTFTITQLFYSQNKQNYIRFPGERFDSKHTTMSEKREILKDYSKSAFQHLGKLKIKECNYADYIDVFQRQYARMSDEQRYVVLPHISFICVVTDIKRFGHILYSYFKLNYPRDKTELIVIDDVHRKDDPRIASLLPNDQSIKYINIYSNNKASEETSDAQHTQHTQHTKHASEETSDAQHTQHTKHASEETSDQKHASEEKQDEGIKYPLGYKLNIALKYSSYSVVCHLFDTNNYFVDSLRNIVKCFVMSGKDLLLSGDSAEYNLATHKSYLSDVPDIANMMYTKDFWKLYNFDQGSGDNNVLVHQWICFRSECVAKIPFMHWSFKISNDDEYTHYTPKKSFGYDLQRLILDADLKMNFNKQ